MTAVASRQTPRRGTAGSSRSPFPRVLLAIPIALLAWTATAGAQAVDPHLWGTNGSVNAIVRDGSTVYVGGQFTEVGQATGGGVPLGTASGQTSQSFPKVLGQVRAVVADGSGGWFIGGDFTKVDGAERLHLAHVLADGSLAPWAPNPNGEVLSLALRGTTLYVGGTFTWIGDRWRNNVAAINVASGIATSWNPGSDGPVRALAPSGSVLFAGGNFSTIGGQPRARIAALDVVSGAATSWSAGANADVFCIAVSGGTVYLGGGFTTISGQPRAHVAAVDAATGVPTDWNPSASSDVFALVPHGGTIYLGGVFDGIGGQVRHSVAQLDSVTGLATSWDPAASGQIYALALDGNTLYVGGALSAIGGQTRRSLAALDATTGLATAWNPNPNSATRALAVAGGTLYAGGSFTLMNCRVRNHIAALDAGTGIPTAWDPNADATVQALAVGNGAVYAGGAFLHIGGSSRQYLGALDASGSATPWDPNPNGPVEGLAVGDDAVYAAGRFTAIGGQARQYVAALDTSVGLATAWNPSPDNLVLALAVSGGTVYAGGSFTNMAGTARNHIAALDAATGLVTAWNPNANSFVRALAVNGSTVYAGGDFSLIGGSARHYLAALNRDTGAALDWSPNPDNFVATLGVSGNTVYAGGGFSSVGGAARRSVVAIDATTGTLIDWNPVTDGWVGTLWVGGGTVYVGGSFTSFGGQPSPYLAAIDGSATTPVAHPTFTLFNVSATNIAIGQTVTINATVRNDGAAADDGRIVFSFKDMTDPLDGQSVTFASGADAPGYRLLPAGSELLGRDCQGVTADYLVAEYTDWAWSGLGAETHTLSLTIRPRTAGVFSIDVRSTMHAAGGGPCDYQSEFPFNPNSYLRDQQGWTVGRFVVYVDAGAAAPAFIGPVALSAPVIVLGQSVGITASVRNFGMASNDGRIVVSFPTLNDPLDGARVSSGSSGDLPGFSATAAGWPLMRSNCQPVTAQCLVAEYADSSWSALSAETDTFSLTVTPREMGDFWIDVRATLRTAGGQPCDYVNALPLDGVAGFTDVQGWPVRRFHVTVIPSVPWPAFLGGGVSVMVGNIDLGQDVTIVTSVRNEGLASDDGRVVFSFPQFTQPDDVQRVRTATGGDAPGFRTLAAGAPLLDAHCQPMTSGYLVAEVVDSSWAGFGVESHPCTLTVRPRSPGIFTIQVRSTMHDVQGGPCEDINRLPPNGDGSSTDQQGWQVSQFFVTVSSRPAVAVPAFVGDVQVSATTLALGGSVTITAAVRDNWMPSDDGRIVLGFPALDQPGDEQYVSSASTGDAPGYREFPPGATMLGHDCQPVAARYLAAEYADASWDSIGNETNTFTVTVRPPREGLFTIEVRSTMRTARAGPCDYVNGLPGNGQSGFSDQQGWEVKRFDVVVGSHSSITWRPIGAVGSPPNARAMQAAVYDRGRDELMLYGGSALLYTGDSWTLPLAINPSWNQLQPGGPVPLRRIRHSMIYDPVGQNLMIFGGFYDDYMNDLWVLGRSPVTWWFPITPLGPRPSPRMGQAAIYDPVRQRMLVIGGFGGAYQNDVWEYSPMVNGTWKELTPAGDPMPPRCNFSAVYDSLRDRVVFFGGDGGTVRNDAWELRLGDAPAWSPIVANGAPPGPRREHTAVYDAQWDEMIVFGGFDGTKRLNDVWTLSLSGTPRWECRFAATPSPAPRSAHSAIYDPVRQRMVVFGGQLGAGAYTNDVWELKIDQATPVALSLAATEVASDHVRLTWFGEGAASLAASVERSTGDDEWFTVGTPSAQGPDQLVFLDRTVVEGTHYAYRLRVWQEGKEEVLGPVWVTVPARAVFSLAGASPNPVSDAFAVAFSLPGEGPGALELFDLRGRLVARRDLAGMAAGPYRMALAEGKHLPAGVYLVRLTHGGRSLTAKACVVR